MNAIRSTQALNQRELDNCIPPEASWHRDYADTAFIYIGGLDSELTEGDIITIFSQYGEPVYINLVRDKETGASKGFAFLKYEDQRSCDLAVDNLGGASVRGRLLRVDHTRYKAREDEDITKDNTRGDIEEPRERHRHKRIRSESGTEREDTPEEQSRPRLKEEELERLIEEIDDEDPMKADMIARKQKEIDRALRKQKHHSSSRRHRHRSRSKSPRRKRSNSRDGRERRRRRSRSPS